MGGSRPMPGSNAREARRGVFLRSTSAVAGIAVLLTALLVGASNPAYAKRSLDLIAGSQGPTDKLSVYGQQKRHNATVLRIEWTSTGGSLRAFLWGFNADGECKALLFERRFTVKDDGTVLNVKYKKVCAISTSSQ